MKGYTTRFAAYLLVFSILFCSYGQNNGIGLSSSSVAYATSIEDAVIDEEITSADDEVDETAGTDGTAEQVPMMTTNMLVLEYQAINVVENEIYVETFDELKTALEYEVSADTVLKIIITEDIEVTESIDILNSYITLTADDGVTLNYQGEFAFTFKNNSNITIENIAFEGYSTNALVFYNSSDVTLTNLDFDGNNTSTRAIDVNGSSVSIDYVSTSNHSTHAIRLINSATLDIEDGNTFENEKVTVYVADGCTINGATEENNFIDGYAYSDPITYYYYLYSYNVTTEQQLIEALGKYNMQINILNDIDITGTYTNNRVTNTYTTNLRIYGDTDYSELDMGGNILYITSMTADIEYIHFTEYTDVIPLYLFNVKGYETVDGETYGATLNNLKFVPASDGANVGLKIVASYVEINNKAGSELVAKNHASSFIEISSVDNTSLTGATLIINSGFDLTGNRLAILGVQAVSHVKNASSNAIEIVNNANELFYTSPVETYYDSLGDVILYRYSLQTEVEVDTEEEFLAAVSSLNNKITITADIQISGDYYNNELDSSSILIEEGITITSKTGNETLDLNGSTLLIKEYSVMISDLNIINGGQVNSSGNATNAIDVYNTEGVVFSNLDIKYSEGYAISVNGAVLYVSDILTESNGIGGIFITRSRTLYSESMNRDSVVYASGTMTHNENGYYVKVVNLELLDVDSENNVIAVPSRYTQNKFIYTDLDSSAKDYIAYVGDESSLMLSEYYLTTFGFKGSDTLVLYNQFDTNYFLEKSELNVLTQTTVPVGWQPGDAIVNNSNTEFIRLDNTGTYDNAEKLETLIAYAGNYGSDIYFPAGTYLIQDSIVLTNILGQGSLANFGLKGDFNGTSILVSDGIATEIMSIGEDADYHFPVINFSSEGMVYDNVSFGFKGSVKVDLSFSHNVFLNGTYEETDSTIYLNAYLDLENSSFEIYGNAFFRTNEHAGKGIYLYDSINSTISNNYFGDLTNFGTGNDVDPSGMLDSTTLRMIETLIANEIIDPDEPNGNFFTGINLVRRDEETLIQNNYFDMGEEKDVVFPDDVPEDKYIYGLNDTSAPHRKDHIIYAKGYDGLYIVGNYFQGMENGGAGGVKVRNGTNLYVGSNYFDNVPLLMYVYADLSHDEIIFEDTVVYNNLFNIASNFETAHAGILFYQSFVNGDEYTLSTSALDSTKITQVVNLDVQDIYIYDNVFSSDDRNYITLNENSVTCSDEFLVSNNVYQDDALEYIELNNITDPDLLEKYSFADKNIEYGLDFSGFVPTEISESVMQSYLTTYYGYNEYSSVSIPLSEMSVYTLFDEALLAFDEAINECLEIYDSEEYDVLSIIEEYENISDNAHSYKDDDTSFENPQSDINLYILYLEAVTYDLENEDFYVDDGVEDDKDDGVVDDDDDGVEDDKDDGVEDDKDDGVVEDDADDDDDDNNSNNSTIKPATLNYDDHMAYIQGYLDGSFNPDNSITRAETIVIFSRLIVETMDIDATYSSSFTDINGDEWYANTLGFMQQFGIVTGYEDGTFRGDEYITRAEFATVASRFDELVDSQENIFSDVSDTHWAISYINSAAAKGWINGYEDGTFKPQQSITRAEVVTLINRILSRSADMDFIDENIDEMVTFYDVYSNHWAYGSILEASNSHDYKIVNDVEKWVSLN
ncbi:MAG: S-layer homology domain-containing protein [Clostridia bacterium]